jgi:hypothetical protein
LKVTAIDKVLLNLGQRLSVFDHYRGERDDDGSENDDNSTGNYSNWNIINATIAEHEGEDWYIPNDKIYNAWTDSVYLTLGNIDLRDFALERKFADMRDKRVKEYNKKWQEALDRNDKDYLDKHACPGLANTFWEGWTKEEIAYYENVERFPILKNKEGYKPNWKVQKA